MSHPFQMMPNTSVQSILAINGAHMHILIQTNGFHTPGPSTGIKHEKIAMERAAARFYIQKWHKWGVNIVSNDRSALHSSLC